MTEPDPTTARNETTDEEHEGEGQLANPGPIPTEPENASDTGEGESGDLTAEARTDRDD